MPCLFLVTGLPFVGQKTLLRKVQTRLKASPSFTFLDPAVSSEAYATEPEQKVLSEDDFKAADTFLVSWKYEGSAGYLISAVEEAMVKTRKVVFRVPRDKLAEVEKKAAAMDNVEVKIINVTATIENILQRAAADDDKFNEKNFNKRLKAIPEAKGNTLISVENDATVEEGVQLMLDALGFDPLVDLPASLDGEGELDLVTCSPQAYLKATVYPFLEPVLARMATERPEDSVEFLALHLHQAAMVHKKRVKELTREKILKTRLREEITREYAAVGRI